MARERELACDDGVLKPALNRQFMLKHYSVWRNFARFGTRIALAADGNKPWLLMERIRRLLGRPSVRKKEF